MSKTIDIATLGEISKNSASLLGKSNSDKIGYVKNTFNEKGELNDVDQTYQPDSTRPQSGKAVAEALEDLVTRDDLRTKVDATISGEKGNALICNDPTGGLMMFTSQDGTTTSAVCVNDGNEDVYAQIYAKSDAGKKAIRLNVGIDGIYYTKNAKSAGAKEAKDELAVKGDINSLDIELESLEARVGSNEDTLVDLNTKIKQLEDLKAQFEELSKRIEDLEKKETTE